MKWVKIGRFLLDLYGKYPELRFSWRKINTNISDIPPLIFFFIRSFAGDPVHINVI